MTCALQVRLGLIAIVLLAVPVGRLHGQAASCPASDPGYGIEIVIREGQVAPAGLCQYVAPGTEIQVRNGLVILHVSACGYLYVALSGSVSATTTYTTTRNCQARPGEGTMTDLSQVAAAHGRGEVFSREFTFSAAPSSRCGESGRCSSGGGGMSPDAAIRAIRSGLQSDGTTSDGIVDEMNVGQVCVNTACLHRASMTSVGYTPGPAGPTTDPLTWIFTVNGGEQARYREVSRGPGYIRLFNPDTQENLVIDVGGMQLGSAGIGPAELAQRCQEATPAGVSLNPGAYTACNAFLVRFTPAMFMRSVDGQNMRRR